MTKYNNEKSEYIQNVRSSLDNAAYGHKEAKNN